jgi:hypothetical protein
MVWSQAVAHIQVMVFKQVKVFKRAHRRLARDQRTERP